MAKQLPNQHHPRLKQHYETRKIMNNKNNNNITTKITSTTTTKTKTTTIIFTINTKQQHKPYKQKYQQNIHLQQIISLSLTTKINKN